MARTVMPSCPYLPGSPKTRDAGCWSSRMIPVYCRSPIASFTSKTDALSGKSRGARSPLEEARSSLQFTVSAKGKRALLALAAIGIACARVAPGPALHAEDAARSAVRAESPDEKDWQAVAPGRIEPVSGEIKIAAPIVGLI